MNKQNLLLIDNRILDLHDIINSLDNEKISQFIKDSLKEVLKITRKIKKRKNSKHCSYNLVNSKILSQFYLSISFNTSVYILLKFIFILKSS